MPRNSAVIAVEMAHADSFAPKTDTKPPHPDEIMAQVYNTLGVGHLEDVITRSQTAIRAATPLLDMPEVLHHTRVSAAMGASQTDDEFNKDRFRSTKRHFIATQVLRATTCH